jgi:hydroxymethyl cephem carbamoyltransferase
MLYFQQVLDPRLQAVTHVDGTARVQTVTSAQNGRMHAMLSAFERKTGVPVLCNTSLNFKGRGFINRMSDLAEYVLAHDVDGMVVGDTFYFKRSLNSRGATAQEGSVHGRQPSFV